MDEKQPQVLTSFYSACANTYGRNIATFAFSPATPTPPPLTRPNTKAVHDHELVPCKNLRCNLRKLHLDADGPILCGLIQAFTFLVSGSIDYLSPNCFSISELIYLMTRSSVDGCHLNTQYPPLYDIWWGLAACSNLSPCRSRMGYKCPARPAEFMLTPSSSHS